MTAPVPARDHANMTVAEREFTFDALLAEFGEEENAVEGDAAPVDETPKVAAPALLPAEAPAKRAEPTPSRRAPDAAAENAAPATRSAAKATTEPRTTSPVAKTPARQSSFAQKARAARRSLAMPSPDVLKLGGLVVVAGISLTLVFVALSR